MSEVKQSQVAEGSGKYAIKWGEGYCRIDAIKTSCDVYFGQLRIAFIKKGDYMKFRCSVPAMMSVEPRKARRRAS